MKKSSIHSNIAGFNAFEVVIVLLILTLLVALLPAFFHRSGGMYPGVSCMSNQRQMALGFTMCADDNGGQYPWQFSPTNDMYMAGCTNGRAVADFTVIANYYVKSPYTFICPMDPARVPTTNISRLERTNLSYFAGYDAGAKPAVSILTGDRHLLADANPVLPGLLKYSTNRVMSWTAELHRKAAPVGVLSFYDAHAEVISGRKLNAVFMGEGLAQGRFAVP